MAVLSFKVEADYEKVIKLREEISKLENQLKSFGRNTPEMEIRTIEMQLGNARQEFSRITTEAAKAGAIMENDFKKKIFDASTSVNDLIEKIIAQRAVIKDVEADVKRLGDSYRTKLKSNSLASDGTLAEYKAAKRVLEEEKAALFGLSQQQAEARLSVKKLRDEYALFKKDAGESVDAVEAIKDSMASWSIKVFAGWSIKELISQMIQVRGQFQAADTAIQTLLGSKEKADALMAQVREYAKISSLEFSDVTAATQMMLGFNIEAEKVPRFLQAIGDVSMGEAQKFNSLTLAFSQMSATGKLMGQDLNQMINAGFNPLQQIATTTGKSIARLKDEMSKGAISAEMVQQAFIDATSAGGKFYQMSENASKTINGQLSMLQDAIDAAFNEMGQASEGLIVSGIESVTSLVENYQKLGVVITGLVATYGLAKTALFLYTETVKGYTITQTFATKATILWESAQKALNLQVLKNPYVLAAVAVGTLITSIIALKDWVVREGDARQRANKEWDEFNKKIDERNTAIKEAINTIQSETASAIQQAEAYERLKNLLPSLTEAYTQQQIAAMNMAEAEKILNEQRDIDTYKKLRDDVEKYRAELEKAKEAYEEERNSYGKNITIREAGMYGAEARLDEAIRRLVEFESLQEQAQENAKPIEGRLDEAKENERIRQEILDFYNEASMYAEQLQDKNNAIQYDVAKANFEEFVDKMQSDVDKLKEEQAKNPLLIIPELAEKEKALDSVKKMKEDWERSGDTTIPLFFVMDVNSAQNALNEAKKLTGNLSKDFGSEDNTVKDKSYWEDKKKEAENALAALASNKEGTAEWKKYKREIQNAQKEIDKYSINNSEKQKKKKEQLIKQQKEYAALTKRQAQERIKSQRDNEYAIWQNEIDLMEEGTKKTIEQIELDYDKQIAAIEDKEGELSRAKISAAKAAFEKNPANKGKVFDESSVDVSLTEDEIRLVQSMREKADAEREKSLADLNDKLLKKQESDWREYLIKFGNYHQQRKALIEKYDAEIAELQKKEGTAGEISLKEGEKQASVESLDEKFGVSAKAMADLFEDASNKSVRAIQDIIDKYELLIKYMSGNTDNGQVVTIDNLKEVGFSDKDIANVTNGTISLKEVTDALKGLKGELKEKSPWQSFKSNITTAINTLKNAKGDIAKIGEEITLIGKSISEFSPALKQFSQDIGNIFGNDDIGNKIAGISDALGGVGQTAAGVGQIMSGDIVGGAMSAVSGISSVVSALDGLFGADYSKYNNMKEQYDTLIDIWDDLIDKKKEYIDIDYGVEAKKAADEARNLVNTNISRMRQLAQTLGESGASIGSHSLNYRVNDRMSEWAWMEVSNLVGQSVNTIQDLFNVAPEKIGTALQSESLVSVLTTVNSEFITYIQNIDKYAEELKEIADAEKEVATGISFDSFRDGYKDLLSDLDGDNEQFSKNFEQYLMNAIMSKAVAIKFKDKIESLYDAFANAGSDNVFTESEVANLKEMSDSLNEEMIAYRDMVKETMGFSSGSSSSSQSSSKATTVQASQDSIDEANGRMTSIAEAAWTSKSLLDVNNAWLSKIYTLMANGVSPLPDLSNTSAEISSNYPKSNPLISVSYPTEQLDAMMVEISNMREKMDNVIRLQAQNILEIQTIEEHTGLIAKNNPKTISSLSDIAKGLGKK